MNGTTENTKHQLGTLIVEGEITDKVENLLEEIESTSNERDWDYMSDLIKDLQYHNVTVQFIPAS